VPATYPIRKPPSNDHAVDECAPVPPRVVNPDVASFPQRFAITVVPPGCIEI
jgi:hypothetical protein